nr:MAG TPA: hypothetical protein [Caudoviricetes sp.]
MINKNRPGVTSTRTAHISEEINVHRKYIVSSSEQPCKRNKSSLAVIFVPKNHIL